MAQLYYRYGTMNSGKTIEILKVAYNYEEQGKGVVIMTSALDTRDGVGYVSSRIGMKRPAIAIEETTDIFGYIRDLSEKTYCVLVDEAQFLKRHHVYDLARVVDELDKTNERVIKKLTSSTSNIKKYLEDEDLLEDTLIETQQAIEMADIYGNVLHSMTETFASIISNNQNNIMKTLALVTIVMSIPTMVFSAYGMNFKDNEIPLNGEPNAFWLIVFIAFAMSVSLTLYLIHKKWF